MAEIGSPVAADDVTSEILELRKRCPALFLAIFLGRECIYRSFIPNKL